jgi:hypothetical protein
MSIELVPVPSLPSYFVTKTGEVFRLRNDRFMSGLFKLSCRRVGRYLAFTTTKKMGAKTKKLHRVMCEAFHGPPPGPEWCALHRDDDRNNNTPENLYWGTAKENSADAVRNGVNSTAIIRSGENHLNATLSRADVDVIRSELASRSSTGKQLAARFGVSPATISLIKNNHIWTK